MVQQHCIAFPQEPIDRRILDSLFGLNAAHAILVLLTPLTGWLYHIDSDNIYHRGPLFWLSVLVTGLLLLASLELLIVHRQRIGRKNFYTLVLFLLPPIAAIVLQVAFYGMSFVLTSVVVSFLIVLLNIQDQDIYTDYLTGINNRKKFDLYLQQKIDSSREGKTFSAIMLDLNGFKPINDVLGHDIGDEALRTVTKLFCSCIGETDFIARIGGDEFCIISDIANEPELAQLAEKINGCLAEFNDTNARPYKLSVSMGCAVYNQEAGMTLVDFKRHIDSLMYLSKKKHLAKN